MEEIARKFALVLADIKECTAEEATDSFNTQLEGAAAALLTQISTKRTQMLEKCQRKRQEIVQLTRDLKLEPSTLPDIVPPYEPLLMELDHQSSELQSVVNARSKKITRYFDEATDIANSIGVKGPKMPASYHLSEVDALKNQLMLLREDRDNRFTRLTSLLDQALKLYQELEYEGEASKLSVDPFDNLRDERLVLLETEIKDLHERRAQRVLEITALTEEISTLAKFLELPTTFSNLVSESYLSELIYTRDDYTRQFEEKMECLTKEALEEYQSHCNHLGIDPRPFDVGSRETYNEILQENQRLKAIINERQKIDTLYTELKKLKDEETSLDEAARDPNRYRMRGAVMIEEGKRRNRLLIRKPRVLKQLQNLASSWQKTHKEPLKVDGEDLGRLLSEEEARGSRKPAARAAVAAKAAITKVTSKISRGTRAPVSRAPSLPQMLKPRVRPQMQPPQPSRTIEQARSSESTEPAKPLVLPQYRIPEHKGLPVAKRHQGSPETPTPFPKGLVRSGGSNQLGRKPLATMNGPVPGQSGRINLSSVKPRDKSTAKIFQDRPQSIGRISPDRERQCCNGLKSVGRSVEIVQFDPNFSMIEDDISPAERAKSNAAYNEWRRGALEKALMEN